MSLIYVSNKSEMDLCQISHLFVEVKNGELLIIEGVRNIDQIMALF